MVEPQHLAGENVERTVNAGLSSSHATKLKCGAKHRARFDLTLIFNKFSLCLLLSSLASLGNAPYAYKFYESLGLSNQGLGPELGVVFALCAVVANIMLGSYSLLNLQPKPGEKLDFRVLLLGALGSIPYGFLCYFGYQELLLAPINLTISTIVVVVNAGISYTAILNVLAYFKKLRPNKIFRHELFHFERTARCFGILVGLMVSLTMYLVTCQGINDLLLRYELFSWVNYKTAYFLAIISWVPVAVLYANANQAVAAELFHKANTYKHTLRLTNLSSVLILIFCIFSGTSIAQMMEDSFNPAKYIPELFKDDLVQYWVHHYLVVLALVSSAALNYFSLQKFKQFWKKK